MIIWWCCKRRHIKWVASVHQGCSSLPFLILTMHDLFDLHLFANPDHVSSCFVLLVTSHIYRRVWDSPGLKHSQFFSLHITSAASPETKS